MQAMILAAGLGTRLRPWTLTHPKALVSVGGIPMLERVINNLRAQGFTKIVINVHHFAQQIIDFINSRDFNADILISNEAESLLDTGGGILNAAGLFDEGPVLVHNVDIISNADLSDLMHRHISSGADSTLLVSDRSSTRKLVFDEIMLLRGWHNLKDNTYRPIGFIPKVDDREYAFSGIHVVGENVIKEMRRIEGQKKFSIIDFLLADNNCEIIGYLQEGLEIIDIGKPETLQKADKIFN